MSDESIVIILPLPNKALSPNFMAGSLGGRMHKATATQKYRRLACEAVEAENVESAPWGVVSVKATFYWPDKRIRDQRNADASMKAAYDGIVDAGLVVNDDYAHMRGELPVFELDKTNPRVMIEISRVDSPS
jgi:Holliday junction resolvase RusA-like endonuclease